MATPPESISLNAEEAEALIVRVHQSGLSAKDAGLVEQVIRMYCWVVFCLQEAKLSLKRLRTLLFGKGAKPPKAAPARWRPWIRRSQASRGPSLKRSWGNPSPSRRPSPLEASAQARVALALMPMQGPSGSSVAMRSWLEASAARCVVKARCMSYHPAARCASMVTPCSARFAMSCNSCAVRHAGTSSRPSFQRQQARRNTVPGRGPCEP